VDLAPAGIGTLHRGVEDADAGAPDVGTGAIPFDERDDRLVGDAELTAGGLDALALHGDARELVGRHVACRLGEESKISSLRR